MISDFLPTHGDPVSHRHHSPVHQSLSIGHHTQGSIISHTVCWLYHKTKRKILSASTQYQSFVITNVFTRMQYECDVKQSIVNQSYSQNKSSRKRVNLYLQWRKREQFICIDFYIYRKTCLIWHLSYPLHCVIRQWFSYSFVHLSLFLHCEIQHPVYSDKKIFSQCLSD